MEAYSSSPLEALEHEIEDGLNAMPSYADKLSEEEIMAVPPTWNNGPNWAGPGDES